MSTRAERRRGFTFLELMSVITILGILTTIALTRFSAAVRHSAEGSAKGYLGAVRSSLMIYYADRDGVYPNALQALTTGGRYLGTLPRVRVPFYHAALNTVVNSAGHCMNKNSGNPTPHTPASVCESNQNRVWVLPATDTGGWAYLNDPAAAQYGLVTVNCTQTDTRGKDWTSY